MTAIYDAIYDPSLTFRALAFAAHKHRDQRRKDAEKSPYINHPIGLATVLSNEAGITDPAVICSALLHDTVEDTNATEAELEQHFGKEISGIVMEVTDDKSLPKAERKRRQIEHASHLSTKAQLVKLADKICNLRDMANSPPHDWNLKRRQEYFDWAKRVIGQIPAVNETLEALFAKAYEKKPLVTGCDACNSTPDNGSDHNDMPFHYTKAL